MRKLLLLLCAIWLLSPVVHASLDESDGIFYLLTKDGNETFTVDGSVTFKMRKQGASLNARDCGVTFLPKNEGEIVVAKIESFSIPTNSVALLVWDSNIAGVKDKIGKSGASSGLGYNYMPAGWCAELKGENPETTSFASRDESGALAFGFHSGYPKDDNFTITVSSIVPADMTYSGATWTPAPTAFRGKENAVLGEVAITTDGIANALNLTSISGDMSALEGKATNISLQDKDGNVLATAANGQFSSITAPVALGTGKNIFYLVGNLEPDFCGTLPQVSFSTVTVAGEDHTVATEGSATIVENTILMPAGPLTYTIGEAANFYDDGGATGKTTPNFSGTVTFVPAEEGHKVKVDFKKLAIFYNSLAASVGNQDVFRFYNGRTADASNLIAELTEQAQTIKSTADDGALTVTFTSKTANPADGWEAVVSMFKPGNMTLSGIESTTAPTTSASAYDTDVALATLNFSADNILNPLAVENIKVKVEGARSLAGLSVYSLGSKDTFSKTNKVGTLQALTDGTLTLNLTDAVLAEGSNYFAIAADVATTALSGETFSVVPVSASVAGTETAITAEASTITVANVFSHHEGSDLREISDKWEFVSTPDPNFAQKYLLSNKDCIVTFAPANGGSAVLEFSEFDVFYSNQSYGTRAVFEIYSGRSVDASKLLWKLDKYEGKPEGVIKSTAEDGSITVKFNANTTSSYYGGKGWKATVTPFINHNMTVEGIAVAQSSTASVMPGAVAEAILNLTVNTEGTLDQRKLTGVVVDLKGSLANVTRVSVLAAGDEGNTEIGSAAVADASELTVACDFTLAEGANTLIVAYDISADANDGDIIDAKVTKIVTDQAEIDVTDGDPEGARKVMNQYLMSAGNHTVTVSKPLHFYDDGGPEGILSKDGLNGTVVFRPSTPGKQIRATVISYSTAATAQLNFYSGSSVIDEMHLGQCKQKTYPALPMVSKAEDGSMIVNVTCNSYSYGTYDGWDILIEEYAPSAIYAQEIKATAEAAAESVRGITDALMSGITVHYEGDFDSAHATGLKAKIDATNLSDVADVKLWYTTKYNAFAPTALLAAAAPDAEGNVTFAFEHAPIDVLGDYYYWLTVSLSREAAVGNTVTVTPGQMTFTGDIALTPEAVAATTAVKAGFAGGQYVVGASSEADYATFAAAVAALGDGIEGPVTFLAEPGTYAEDINIKNVKGTSETNTITITSQSGNAADVILTGAGYVDTGYNTVKYGVVNIEGTDWVTLNKLTVNGKKTANSEYPYYVYLLGACRHNTVSNCSFIAETPEAGVYSGLNVIGTALPKDSENNTIGASGLNADFLTIADNTFTGGYNALNIQGSQGYVAYEPLKNLTVTGNRFTDVGSKCIYPYQIEDVTISGNTMVAGTAVAKTGYFGIDGRRLTGIIDICNNVIVNNQTVYSGGIQLMDSYGSAERPARIFNNAIAITAAPSTSSAGMTIESSCYNIEFAHNSVNVDGTAGHGIAISRNYTQMRNIKFTNNIVRVNGTATSDFYAFSFGSIGSEKFTFANNAFHSSSKLSAQSADAEAWTTATGDATLIAEEAKFLSNADLHLSEAGNLEAGVAVNYIKTDLDGNRRQAVPTVGAYEFAPLSQDKPELTEGYPRLVSATHNTANVAISWNMSGTLHYVALPASAEAPEADALTSEVSATADAEVAVKFADLADHTAYKAYFMLEGANGVNSDIAECAFTTAYLPLTVELDLEQDDIDAGEQAVITPLMAGGDGNYTYSWTNRLNREISTEESLTVSPEQPEIYTLSVTSGDGQAASDFTVLKVYGTKADATFEDNALAAESYYYTTNNEDKANVPFFSGAFAFNNNSWLEYNMWGGFAYANLTTTSFGSLFPGQFCNVAGGGHESATYAVAYYPGSWMGPTYACAIEVLADRNGAELDHVYVTNSAYTHNSIVKGDAYADPFAAGDYHKVIFTGDDPEGQPVEFYLADFRNGASTIVTDWSKVDLKPLGKHVKNVTVTTESSNEYVPAYAVLDNLAYASAPDGIDDLEIDLQGADILLARVYSLDGALRMSIERPAATLTAGHLAALNSGVYVVEYVLSDGRRAVRKLALR